MLAVASTYALSVTLLTRPGICRLFETKLKEQNPNARNITYDVKDLFNWIDSLGDMGALVLDARIKGYNPYDKEWVKEKVLNHLKKMAAGR